MKDKTDLAPATDRREAVCDVTRSGQYNPNNCKFLDCPIYRVATLAADARRQVVIADLKTGDPSLNVEPRIFMARGGA